MGQMLINGVRLMSQCCQNPSQEQQKQEVAACDRLRYVGESLISGPWLLSAWLVTTERREERKSG